MLARGRASPSRTSTCDELAAVFPGLAATNQPTDSSAPPPPVPQGVGMDRYRLHRAVSALLDGVAAGRAILLLVDDLHWADPASVELLLYLLRRPPSDAPVRGGRVSLAAAAGQHGRGATAGAARLARRADRAVAAQRRGGQGIVASRAPQRRRGADPRRQRRQPVLPRGARPRRPTQTTARRWRRSHPPSACRRASRR